MTIDVSPKHMLMQEWSPFGDLWRDIQEQWNHARIGTFYCYFDVGDRLHLHFVERGSYLEQKGEMLGGVRSGHLPAWLVHPAANVTDSKALEAVEVLVALPTEVDPNDPRWGQVKALLEEMQGST